LNTKKNEVIENDIVELVFLVSNYFLEKDLFNMYYEQFMENRLLNTDINLDLEKKLVSKFKQPIDNKVIQNMIYKLEDVDTIKKDLILYERANIRINSDKYKGKIDPSSIENKRVKANIFRDHAWTYTRENNTVEIKPPFELAPYIDIWNGFVMQKYPYKNVKWNFNQGIAVIDLELGGKIYKIKLTTPQLLVIYQFNSQPVLTAMELANNIGISLQKLGMILTSLLKSRLIKRVDPISDNKNPNMKLALNDNFTYESSTISIVSLMNNTIDRKAIDKEIYDSFLLTREESVRASIVRTIKQNKNMNYVDLFNRVKTSIPFKLEEELFTNVLKSCENEFVKTNIDSSYSYLEDDDNE
jgi:hypothetical protein